MMPRRVVVRSQVRGLETSRHTRLRENLTAEALLLVGVLFLSASTVQAGVVTLPWMHASITLPSDWTYQVNFTDVTEVAYDVAVGSPITLDGEATGVLSHFPYNGSLPQAGLFQMLMSYLHDERLADLAFVVEPRNITVGGLPACDAIFTIMAFTERYTLAFSAHWHLVYFLEFGAPTISWSSYSSMIDSIINSLSIDQNPSGTIGSLAFAAIGLGAMAVAVVAVILVLIRRRNGGHQPMGPQDMAMPDHMQPSTPPKPPPVPPGAS
jgi:hypothetical protein